MISSSRIGSFLLMIFMFMRPLFAAERASGATRGSGGEKEVVVLLHGICKSKLDMVPMARSLRKEGFQVVNWSYPSTKNSIEDIADKLNELIQPYNDKKVNFVTHSMGGIVVRTYLTKYKPTNCGRFIMIAPPNKGAVLADILSNFTLYKLIMGPAGLQLRQGDSGACEKAGIPSCDFGIIAGGSGKETGINPLIKGDNDGTVSVECTKLDGASDFLLLPYHHPYIQYMPRTIHNTIAFLHRGKFCETQKLPPHRIDGDGRVIAEIEEPALHSAGQ